MRAFLVGNVSRGTLYNKAMKAVLFDYNGTLFEDDDINEEAWRRTYIEITGKEDGFLSLYQNHKGLRNDIFIESIFKENNIPVEKEKIAWWSKRKETEHYQKICLEHKKRGMRKGAEKLLNYLKKENIPFTMCTASIRENRDFYFAFLHLDRWFDINEVVYDSGDYRDKGEMYLEGARRLGTEISNCLVIDDSPGSILKAVEAGCRNVVIIQKDGNPDLPQIRQKISDFNEFDYSLLKGAE